MNQVGDTFSVSIFGAEFLFTFSPLGLKSLYSVRESDASFTEATRGLLGLKLPSEVIEGGNMKKFFQVISIVAYWLSRACGANGEVVATGFEAPTGGDLLG